MIENELIPTESEINGHDPLTDNLQDVCDDLSLGWGRSSIGVSCEDENEIDMSFTSFGD